MNPDDTRWAVYPLERYGRRAMAVLVWRRQIICDTDVTLGIAPQLQRTNDTVGSRVTG